MAPFCPVTDGVQAELVFVLDGEVLSNRLWFTFDNPPFDHAALLGLADGLHEWHRTLIMPSLAHELILYQTRVTDWTADPPSDTADHFGAVQGGNLSGCHSANVSVVVPFKWTLGLREKRNKHYVPGIPLDQVSLNTVSHTLSAALYEAYSSLIDDTRGFYPVFNWRWRVASAYDGGALRSSQLVRSCQGPVARDPYLLGQRRRRLPL